MEIPRRVTEQLTKIFLYPLAFSNALEAHALETGEKPVGLWRCLVLMSSTGVIGYGFTISLLIPSWPAWATIFTLLIALATGWSLFLGWLLLLSPETEPAPWLRLHYAVLAMAFGEVALEGGMALNVLFWLTRWLTEPQAKALALTWLALTSITMSVILVSAWRARRAPLKSVLLPWLVLFHGASAAVIFLLGPALGIGL